MNNDDLIVAAPTMNYTPICDGTSPPGMLKAWEAMRKRVVVFVLDVRESQAEFAADATSRMTGAVG
jgi:thiamine pyrophosphate-dependent acetolactate synthase large subunit-like protein